MVTGLRPGRVLAGVLALGLSLSTPRAADAAWDDARYWPNEVTAFTQETLQYFGFYTSTVDGLFGPGTKRGVDQAIAYLTEAPDIPWDRLPEEIQIAMIRVSIGQYAAARAVREMDAGRPSPIAPATGEAAELPEGPFSLPEPARRENLSVMQTMTFDDAADRCRLDEVLRQDGQPAPILTLAEEGSCRIVEQRGSGQLILMHTIERFTAEPPNEPNALRMLRLAQSKGGQEGLPAQHAFGRDGELVVLNGTAYEPGVNDGGGDAPAPAPSATPPEPQPQTLPAPAPQ